MHHTKTPYLRTLIESSQHHLPLQSRSNKDGRAE
uniref:Uncharacterized protein n=1 Tax=Parascaris equorum TaxID=6256 RepID=A0A914RQR6_PAREQ